MDVTERRIQTVCLLVLAALALGFMLYYLRAALIPFALAAVFVLCLTPIIDLQVRRWSFKRGIAVVNTMLLGLMLLLGAWLVIWESASQLIKEAPEFQRQITKEIHNVPKWLPLDRVGISEEEFENFVRIPREATTQLVEQLGRSTMTLLTNGFLVLVFMVFMLTGTGIRQPPKSEMHREIELRVKRYVVTKVLISLLTAVCVGVTLWVLKVPLALVFGVLVFLLNFIPSIGSIIATFLPLPIVWLDADMSVTAKIAAIVIPALTQIFIGNFLDPKILGRSLDLHPVTILMALICFGGLWGPVGMFLATPLIVAVKIGLEQSEITSPFADILAGRVGD